MHFDTESVFVGPTFLTEVRCESEWVAAAMLAATLIRNLTLRTEAGRGFPGDALEEATPASLGHANHRLVSP